MITGAVMLFSSVAMANVLQAEVTSSSNYTTGCTEKVPEQQCSIVDVPTYSQGSASTGDVLAGAIIGGVIGNQFGKGKGNDVTVLGAIIGADTAIKRTAIKLLLVTSKYNNVTQSILKQLQIKL